MVKMKSIESAIKYHLAGLHTAIPAIVQSYDHVTQLAVVEPTVNELLLDDRQLVVPPIIGVPVVFPSAAGGILSFPLGQGDAVLVLSLIHI